MNNNRANEDISVAYEILSILQSKFNIKLFAFDQDLTILDTVAYPLISNAKNLGLRNFRPCFRLLLTAAMQQGLNVCVVTYQKDPEFVREILRYGLPNTNASTYIHVETSPFDLPLGHGDHLASLHGKEVHLQQAQRKMKLNLKPSEIILFDDNADNIRIARSAGHMVYKVENNIDLNQILAGIKHASNTVCPNCNPQHHQQVDPQLTSRVFATNYSVPHAGPNHRDHFGEQEQPSVGTHDQKIVESYISRISFQKA